LPAAGSSIFLPLKQHIAVLEDLTGDGKLVRGKDMEKDAKSTCEKLSVFGKEGFRRAAHKTAELIGCPWAFTLAILMIIGWLISGPFFHFSDTWQLVINTSTTIITFLVVFLIQNTQNRDARAIHLKLDELIRAMKGARNQLVNLEALSDEELDRFQKEFERIRELQEIRKKQLVSDEQQEEELSPAGAV
jgi:low affinity Fe/Cu permease